LVLHVHIQPVDDAEPVRSALAGRPAPADPPPEAGGGHVTTVPQRRSWLHIPLVVLAVGASVVFIALWAGLAWALLVDPELPAAAWTWLRGLEPAVQVLAWLAILPIAVGLWAWTASWPPPVAVLVVLLLAAWTASAIDGTIRLLRAR
jgi:hypothetical protein